MAKDTCSVDLCERIAHGLGFCTMHYQRFRRNKSLDGPGPVPGGGKCALDWCERAAYCKGYCEPHYNQQRLGQQFTVLRKRGKKAYIFEEDPYHPANALIRQRAISYCLMPDCNGEIKGRGMCATHAKRAAKHSLTVLQLMQMFEIRECECCGRGITPETMHLDHDHECCAGSKLCGNCTRGVLCRFCNMGIGQFFDSIDLLDAAKAYLSGRSTSELAR